MYKAKISQIIVQKIVLIREKTKKNVEKNAFSREIKTKVPDCLHFAVNKNKTICFCL